MPKSKYETHVLPKLVLVEAWARDGLSLEQIAHNLGVADSTFRDYKTRYPALSAALARGKEVVDIEVENDLLKKCHGYNATITKHYKVKRVEYDPKTGKRRAETEELVEVLDEVHVPADTTAIMFWLANRRREKWSYKPEGGGESEGTGVVELAPVDTEPVPPVELLEDGEAVENGV